MPQVKAKTGQLSPAKLRAGLFVTIILLIAAAAGSFWFFRTQLTTYAETVSKAATDARISENNIAKLKSLEKTLEENEVAVTRAAKIVGDSKHYQYQNQIIEDINSYAQQAGVTVASYTFTSSDATAGAGAATGATATPGSVPAPSGLNITSVNVAITNPVDYSAMMKFVYSLENNLTKMQLTGISMTSLGSDSSSVNVNPLTIEVYIK